MTNQSTPPHATWTFPDLSGHRIRLIKAEAAHTEALFAITPPDTFKYFVSWPREWSPKAFADWYNTYRVEPSVRMYVAIDESTGRIVGSSSFLDIDPKNRCVEVGATWYEAGARGTHVNPACKFLLLRHAFESLGCIRVTIKCNANNLHSQAAIKKLGATYEGVLRRHRVQCDGLPRDTMYFSILHDEWPRVRERLLTRLERRPAAATVL